MKMFLSLLVAVAALVPLSAAAQEKAPAFEEILKIDVHSHIFEDVPEFIEMMRRTNLRIVNVCVRGNEPERLVPMAEAAVSQQKKYPDAFRFASTSPFYVEIGKTKRRISRQSAKFFLDWVAERAKRVPTKLGDLDKLQELLVHHAAAGKFWKAKLKAANAD